MIRIKTNISQAVAVTVIRLKSLADNDKMLRTCANTALDLMKVRIHQKGLDADNTQIGTYSKAYMVVRVGSFKNAARVSRGKNKGKLKDAGTFTKGGNMGKTRPKLNRSADTKVILSLTRQMENDLQVLPIKTGSYGIGYSNTDNFKKAQWNEAKYKRQGKIFALSSEEQEAVKTVALKFAKDAFSE